MPHMQSCRKDANMCLTLLLSIPIVGAKIFLKESDAFIRELPILVYNSSKYDLPLIQTVLIRELVEKIDFVIKKAFLLVSAIDLFFWLTVALQRNFSFLTASFVI